MFSVGLQNAEITTPTCIDRFCASAGGRAYVERKVQQGLVAIVGINRNAGNQKLFRSVRRPSELCGMTCEALLAHQGSSINSGHWIAFLKQGGIWWRVDTAMASPVREDPFLSQTDYTLDIFFFK